MTFIFQAGGPLPDDHPVYVIRQADADAFGSAIIGNSEILKVVAPRHLGKSSLLKRLRHRLLEEGWRCCYIDLSILMKLPRYEWYASLGDFLSSELTPGNNQGLKNHIEM